MSIYATLWTLGLPAKGDDDYGCDWVEVLAQAIPGHVGPSLPDYGYEDSDPYASFLPPAIIDDPDCRNRAVVFVVARTPKGTARSGQEYAEPLLKEYESITFVRLHAKICDLLRDERPRVVAQIFQGGSARILREDGSSEATS